MVSVGVAALGALLLLLAVVIWRREIFGGAEPALATAASAPVARAAKPSAAKSPAARPESGARDSRERERRAQPRTTQAATEQPGGWADSPDVAVKPAAYAAPARVPASHAVNGGDRGSRRGRPAAPARGHAPDPVG